MKTYLVALASWALAAPLVQNPCAQTQKQHSECSPILQFEWRQDPSDKTAIDRLTVCEDGTLLASHEFTAPAFGDTPAEPTKWKYQNNISKDSLADLRRVLLREDIFQLSAEVKVPVPRNLNPDYVQSMEVFILRETKQRRVIVSGPLSLTCAPSQPEIPETVRDLICLFGDLYERAKSGKESGDPSCRCKSLHEMSVSGSSQ